MLQRYNDPIEQRHCSMRSLIIKSASAGACKLFVRGGGLDVEGLSKGRKTIHQAVGNSADLIERDVNYGS